MVRSVAVYIGALFCAVLLYIAYPPWFSWYLLMLVLLVLPFDLLISLPGMLTKSVSLRAPRMLEKGSDGFVTVDVETRGRLVAGGLRFVIRETTEEEEKSNRRRSAAAGGKTQIPVDTGDCGIQNYELRCVRAVSLLGLFIIPLKAGGNARTLILPKAVMPRSVAMLPRSELRFPKPGGGFSEEYDLRPYRQGDPMNSVHWKLSAKLDSLIIREPLIAPAHSRLVKCAKWNNPRSRELVLGRLRWMSDYLLEQELAFYVQLGDAGSIMEITREEDLVEYLLRELGGTQAFGASVTPPVRFSWVCHIDAGVN